MQNARCTTFDSTELLAWDHENRMTSAALSGGSTATYVYDALGRRVRRFTSGNVEDTKFTYDGDDVLLDDHSGTLTKYLNGEGIDNKLRSQTGTSVNYFLTDHLGSANGIADASGAVTSSNSFGSFGNPSNTSFPNRYQFTGREFDSFTGLQFSRARWYDPKIGRFISEDPIGFGGGGVNLYGYVGNNPGNFVDPFGLFPDVSSFYHSAADGLQGAIERGRRTLVDYDPHAIDRNAAINFLAGALSGTAGLLRTGTSAGQGIYCEGIPDYRRLEMVSDDVVNAGTLFLTMAAPGARFVKSPSGQALNSKLGPEFHIGDKGARVAPFGNRVGHPIGTWPHYHRRRFDKWGETLPNQGIRRHRPLEKKPGDKSFWDRF